MRSTLLTQSWNKLTRSAEKIQMTFRQPILIGLILILIFMMLAILRDSGNLFISLNNFNRLFSTIYLGLALFVLLGIVTVRQTSDNKLISLIAMWSGSFIIVLILAALLTYYVNPHARFSSSRFPYITPSARLIKLQFYKNLPYNAEIIVLGTSRAFTISPTYIEQKTGLRAFNMSVEGSRTFDVLTQIKYIIANQQKGKPHVFVIEIGLPSLYSGIPEVIKSQPINLLPYVNPSQQAQIVINYVEDIFSIGSLSDSFFLLFNPDVSWENATWVFAQDGFGIRKPVNSKEYETLIEMEKTNLKTSYDCNSLDVNGQTMMQEIASLSLKSQIGIVFYQSPTNSEFFEAVLNNNDQFEVCQQKLQSFMLSLEKQFPNIQYINLIQDIDINDLRENGFYDARHLKPNAANLLIDALSGSIIKSVEWTDLQK